MKKYILLAVTAALIVSTVIIVFSVHKSKATKGRIAFIIDDWGYNKNIVGLLFEIDRPVTAAVLPNLRYSKDIAEEINKEDNMYDVILHLPLESKSNKAAEPNTIRDDMSASEVEALLERDMKGVPGIIGISSHQGSKATEDIRLMTLILNDCKKRNLFFVDSLTTPDSVCSKIARDIGLRFAERDVFLDLTDQADQRHFEAYIKNQIKELARIALANKTAIGIGHTKPATLRAIKESIPELEKQGIKIVPLKGLVK